MQSLFLTGSGIFFFRSLDIGWIPLKDFLGALTSKSFPFILRSWNIKSYFSFNLTDSFGQNIRVYVNKNKIIKVEPQFSNESAHSWLTDKGRLFFDSFFDDGRDSFESSNSGSHLRYLKQWEVTFKSIYSSSYLFNICNFKYGIRVFFVLVFENVSIEVINFLSLISQLNSFIKIRRAEKAHVETNLESDFQIDSATSKAKLSASSLCLLIGTNPRYEGSYLNLKLRQRYLKGNFRLFSLGSFLDLTFPVFFLGAGSSVLKNIVAGNHVFCKDIVYATNPIFVTNTEVFKQSNVQEIISVLKYSNVLTQVWNGLNVLNSSLFESSLHSFSRFSFLMAKDLTTFSFFYALNVNLENVSNLKALMESRLLQYKSFDKFLNERSFVNQNICNILSFAGSKKFLYAPSSAFFESQETFVNTEGFRKVSSKLILKKNARSDWQVLRKLAQNFLTSNFLSSVKDHKILFYNSSSLFDFKNFINLHFQATPNLTNLNEYLLITNQKFVLYKNLFKFKRLSKKVLEFKLKYWLDNFYLGGKESFCQNSVNLIRCSSNYKLQVTNFF